jgi:hypothetical protein
MECLGSITESKRYVIVNKQSKGCIDCCLLAVLRGNWYLVEGLDKVNLAEDGPALHVGGD